MKVLNKTKYSLNIDTLDKIKNQVNISCFLYTEGKIILARILYNKIILTECNTSGLTLLDLLYI